MSEMLKPCQSYEGNRCKDGFPVMSPVCWGHSSTVTPWCCKETLCGRLYPHTGEPFKEREYLRANQGGQQ